MISRVRRLPGHHTVKMSSSTWASVARGSTTQPLKPTTTTAPTQNTSAASPRTATNANHGTTAQSPTGSFSGGVDHRSRQSTAHSPPQAAPRHQRKEAHQPRSAGSSNNNNVRSKAVKGASAGEEEYYIVSLLTDPKHHADMSALRKQWFPRKLLKVDAHITLFHALPGSQLDEVRRDLARTAGATGRFDVLVGSGGVFRMGKGVGVEMDRVSLTRVRDLREGLRAKWDGEDDGQGAGGWLSEQDARRGWKGHYTVMNKEDDAERVQACLEELKEGWRGSRGVASGLSLWRYDRGWWRKTEDFLFASGR